MDQAGCIGRFLKFKVCPFLDGSLNPMTEKISIHNFFRVKGPHADANLRKGAKSASRQELLLVRQDIHGLPGLRITVHPHHRPREDPGVPAKQGFFPAGL
jgi:hypothetical protein